MSAFLARFNASDYIGLERVALLKKLDAFTSTIFRESFVDTEDDAGFKRKIERVVFESNMAGLEEFSPEWFRLIQLKMQRMQLNRDFICAAVQELGETSGFNTFERELITGSASISTLYDEYYLQYLASVQERSIIAAISASPPAPSLKDCYSHYTIVQHSQDTGYRTTSFAKHFEAVLGPIISAMDSLIAKLGAVPNLTDDQQKYISFFEHYRLCHSTDASADVLEELWSELDRKWMDTKGDIQIVHDIETGYGDPLRMKATPDFSLRFLDDTYAEENTTIRTIQSHMESYFRGRGTKIAKDGLNALSNTMAGIYYIPFKTGISLQFSFSGQSIPNREDIKVEKGVKIYFDAVETEARVNLNLAYVRLVFNEPEAVIAKYKPDAVEQLVWHVAAHEVGHAIYNLDSVAAEINMPGMTTLLEEPRAELTAMFTLRLLHTNGMLALPHLKECLAHFALDALRYFAKFRSEPLRPYIIFQIYAWKVYHKHGYLTENATGLVEIDDSKTLDVLDEFCQTFEAILDCEDAMNGAGLQRILDDMGSETEFIQRVVAKVL